MHRPNRCFSPSTCFLSAAFQMFSTKFSIVYPREDLYSSFHVVSCWFVVTSVLLKTQTD